jgi:hypothetical protein
MLLTHSRFGSLSLGLSALLLALFPLVRPFFRLDPTEPAETLAAASPHIVSLAWVVAHLLCTLAFVLLLYGLIFVYAALASSSMERRAFWAMVFSFAGIALILPMLGIETYTLPILGRLYQTGQSEIFPAIEMIYRGLPVAMFVVALVLLAAGAITLATAIWRSRVLPRWAGVLLAAGLALWFPPFPEAVRMVDGVVIGAGGVWLAASLWQRASDRQAS